jgi:hypothetical protein
MVEILFREAATLKRVAGITRAAAAFALASSSQPSKQADRRNQTSQQLALFVENLDNGQFPGVSPWLSLESKE